MAEAHSVVRVGSRFSASEGSFQLLCQLDLSVIIHCILIFCYPTAEFISLSYTNLPPALDLTIEI